MNLFHGYKFNYLFQEVGNTDGDLCPNKILYYKAPKSFCISKYKGLLFVKITGRAGNGSKRKHGRNHPLPGGRRHVWRSSSRTTPYGHASSRWRSCSKRQNRYRKAHFQYFKEHEWKSGMCKICTYHCAWSHFGKTQEKEITLYNLDVIISVGYRVKATSILVPPVGEQGSQRLSPPRLRSESASKGTGEA